MVKGKNPGIYQGILLRRGSYTFLRLLATIAAAGENGIETRRLLDDIGTHAIQHLIDKAEDLQLIERVPGESEHGHFPPVYNTITERGRQLLQSQL